jgi:16S rRNA (guanine(1405)-N(7))-methyltransferase
MAKVGLNGRTEVRDLITDPPAEPADLILLLKTLPVLEQIEKGAAARLLDVVNGRYLLITFPMRSLGGRQKGMAQNYEAMFRGWVDGRDWHVRRFQFPTELAFLVTTNY